MLKWVPQAILVLALPCRASAADPETPPSTIRWEAVAGCPTESELIRRVEERLGQPLMTPREQSLRMHARVSRDPRGGFEVVLATAGDSGAGERRISNASCEKLTDAAALVMAIAIDPKRLEPGAAPSTADSASLTETAAETPTSVPRQTVPEIPTTSPAPPKTASSEPSPRGSLAESTDPPPPAPLQVQARLGANAILGTGLLPLVDWGVRGGIALRMVPSAEFRMGAGTYLPMSLDIFGGPGRVSVSASFVDVGACAVRGRGDLQLRACASTEVGVMRAAGKDLRNQHTEQAPYSSVLLEVGYSFRLRSGVGLGGSAAAGATVLRPKFGVGLDSQVVEVYRSEPALLRLGFGVFWDVR